MASAATARMSTQSKGLWDPKRYGSMNTNFPDWFVLLFVLTLRFFSDSEDPLAQKDQDPRAMTRNIIVRHSNRSF